MTTGIETTAWGDVWKNRANLPETASRDFTPWTAAAMRSIRYGVHLLAFLDGYDVRAGAAENKAMIELATHDVTTRRNAVWGAFEQRKNWLRGLKCGTPPVGYETIYWGSSALKGLAEEVLGYPTERTITWSTNPKEDFYDEGCGWMPCFRSLQASTAFPNEAYYPAASGIAVWTWFDVNVHEQGSGTFSEFLEEATTLTSSEYPAFPYTSFDDLLDYAFGSAAFANHDGITTTTRRLDYKMLAETYQALSLFDTTYYEPPSLVGYDKYEHGLCKAGYTATGTKYIVITDGEPTVDEGKPTGWSPALGSNTVTMTQRDGSAYAPRLRISRPGAITTGEGSSVQVGSYFVHYDELRDLAAYAHEHYESNAIIVYCEGDYARVVAFPNEEMLGIVYGSMNLNDGRYPITVTGTATLSYTFQRYRIPAVQTSGVDLTFPKMSERLSSEQLSLGFFKSFCATAHEHISGLSSDVNFADDQDWDEQIGYGYAFDSRDQKTLDEYPSLVRTELEGLWDKIASLAGQGYDNDPAAYMGGGSTAIRVLNSMTQWTPELGFEPTGSQQIGFTITDGRVVFDGEEGGSEGITIGIIKANVTGTATQGYEQWERPDALAADTALSCLATAHWDFPQVKRAVSA